MQRLGPAKSRPKRHLKELEDCTHVFVRINKSKLPFSSPDDGPFLVIRQESKAVVIQRPFIVDTISIDRVKPAHIDNYQCYLFDAHSGQRHTLIENVKFLKGYLFRA